jgi:ABC-2 type transport system permease protein
MNWIGTRALLKKEVRRFLRVPGQTIASPLVSTTLYFLVFGYTVGSRGAVGGIPYISFIVPGLVFLGVANNSFLNSSSSLFITKIQGTVVDLLVAPLGPWEMLIGFVTGAMSRGLLVGVLTWLAALIFTPAHALHLGGTLFFLLFSSYVFAILGLLAGLWAEKFEQINFFPTFLMLPLTFLGGVFYDVRALPEPFRTISLFNPVVHMVEGLRAGMLGLDQSAGVPGAVLLLSVAAGGTMLAYALLRSGYKLKS